MATTDLAYAVTTIVMELQPQRLLAAFAPDLVERPSASEGKRSGSR